MTYRRGELNLLCEVPQGARAKGGSWGRSLRALRKHWGQSELPKDGHGQPCEVVRAPCLGMCKQEWPGRMGGAAGTRWWVVSRTQALKSP